MALYLLIELFRIHRIGQLGEVFAIRRPGRLPLPALLSAAGIIIYLLGARPLFA
jgi:hypothetical protein